jgi:hypothetical protein
VYGRSWVVRWTVTVEVGLTVVDFDVFLSLEVVTSADAVAEVDTSVATVVDNDVCTLGLTFSAEARGPVKETWTLLPLKSKTSQTSTPRAKATSSA